MNSHNIVTELVRTSKQHSRGLTEVPDFQAAFANAAKDGALGRRPANVHNRALHNGSTCFP